jgi:hypothetical protein
MEYLLEPFNYNYMTNAMWVSALVGGVCAFLSCYLMLKGWSLIGDALAHSVVPGVAGAYILGLPFALGAFIAGGLAAGFAQTVKAFADNSAFILDLFQGLLEPTMSDQLPIGIDHRLAQRWIHIRHLRIHEGGNRQVACLCHLHDPGHADTHSVFDP